MLLVDFLTLFRDNAPTRSALELLYENRVSAVAIVNENLEIVGNLSASNLRGLTPTLFEHERVLDRSVIEFLSTQQVCH